MFNKKKKRIAELEKELKNARENLAAAYVRTGFHPSFENRVEVVKGTWYRHSYLFMHDGSSDLRVKDLMILAEDSHIKPHYFDGKADI